MKTAGETSARRVLIPRSLPAAALTCAAAGSHILHLDGSTMGTRWLARCVAPSSRSAATLRATITSAFDLIIRQMSHWEPSSELRRFNSAAPGTLMRLSPEFFEVLDLALRVAADSNGAYDPTVGRMVDLHGFGPTPPEPHLPLPSTFESAARHLGWHHLTLNPHDLTALQPGGCRLDLSSIAKGYAVDLAASSLLAHGISSFMLEIGGEIRGEGTKPDHSPWWCSLENPPGPQYPPLPETVAALCGMSIATSGDAVRRREVGGTEICHLIDPRSGRPVIGNIASVSVLTPRCVIADAWATALFVAGAGAGMRLAEEKSLAARFVLRTPRGLEERWSSAYAAMLED